MSRDSNKILESATQEEGRSPSPQGDSPVFSGPGDPLSEFLTPVATWFRQALGEPTVAQREGWASIREGRHTLILAPTGSGKTLAAFLACLDTLWRESPLPQGVRVLYVSPLKALNYDIYRNLQVPLAGVADTAQRSGQPLPAIEVAVRTGDTPAAERRRLPRRPPHILITTPESLHLLLTSKARDALRGVTHCIVDEIHAVCANKRGVFLALLLERLAALNPHGFVRVGLSATQRPLEEVARYLGGSEFTPEGKLQPRPVTIVDAGLRKHLDLRVLSPVPEFGPLPERSVWPSIYRLLSEQIRQHRSTIVFANNRRTVERITTHLNEAGQEAKAHHGSISLEVRQQTEQALKDGRLPAVVATASLELGIDMGAVDLVCQVESPGSVARGLQRVGRAGHLVGQTSKGRLIPKTPADLLEQAVLAREMIAGRVEEIHVPRNCLDVLAQQVVAMVAVDSWEVPALYALVRQAYPYQNLSPRAFESVLEMISGRWHGERANEDESPSPDHPRSPTPRLAGLKPRISWDRVHNRLHGLPGSRQLAVVSGGTIPDTGQYAAYLGNGVRIGELDEEFIYERRVGDVFFLGTSAWRLERIDADRIIVAPREGAAAMVPFWRGEKVGRSYDLGLALGRFLRELADRLPEPDCQRWLENEFCLDPAAARNVRNHVRRQLESARCLPTDRTLLVEAFRDELGDWQIAFLSPFGSRFHFTLRLALEARLRQRLGYSPQCLHHDDGVLIRLADTDTPPLDLLDGLAAENVEALVLQELADSALFALRFRQNAARALVLPRTRPGKRAPLWLQRLRGRDLLQVARGQPDFPIIAETFRECLHDHLDLPRLQQVLDRIRAGDITVVASRAESPSPFVSGLVFAFTAAFMYQYDDVEGAADGRAALDPELLEQLVTPERQDHLLDPRAVQQVERRLRGLGRPPRTPTEMAEWLRRLGDLAPSELEGPMPAFLQELQADGRATCIELPNCREPRRWVLAEEEPLYRDAFKPDGRTPNAQSAAAAIFDRFMHTHALVGLRDVLDRYPFEAGWAERKLEEWGRNGRLVAVPGNAEQPSVQWSVPDNWDQVQRASLALLRREVISCAAPEFADFVLRWQRLHPATRREDPEGLADVLERLEGLPLPAPLWEQSVLPARVTGYQPRWLDEVIASGEWTWICQGGKDAGTDLVAFCKRQDLAALQPPVFDGPVLDPQAERVLQSLRARGASFVSDLAQDTSIAPSAVRESLESLLRRGLVTNDHFHVVRQGPERQEHDPKHRFTLRSAFRTRRAARTAPEGRWSLLAWGQPDPETQVIRQVSLLLGRYGIAARELTLLDPWTPPWRMLYEVLSKMELAGKVRRGYFVEGLSGAQFALPEAARMLQERESHAGDAPVVLVHSLDPANLYGAGAPFDMPLLDGGSRPLVRRAGTWLVLRAGRPVLIIEQYGKRLTLLANASASDRADAVACLPVLLRSDRSLASHHKLTVEEWNGQPVTSTEGADLLAAAGFVRDYVGMTLYSAVC